MYKIKEFSKLTALSISTLRYYEKLGILFPERVDKQNNYCYYDNNSYFRVTLIKGFKEMGFSLTEIGQMLDNTDDEKLYAAIVQKKAEITKKISELKKVLKHVSEYLNLYEQE